MSTAQTQTLRRDRSRGASAPARKDPHVNPGTVSRIPFLTGPEDRLLLNEDPITFLERFDAFAEASALDPDLLLASPVVKSPLPVSVKSQAWRERFASVKPEFLWHPMMWLPEHLAFRIRYQFDDSSEPELESDDVWAIRVGLELTANGVYDPDSGTWLDVLAYHGLDKDSPVDRARIAAWIAGAADPVLDSIDLTALTLNRDDPQWSLRIALQLADDLVPAQWAMTATSIIETIETMLLQPDTDDALKRRLLEVMSQVAAVMLKSVPADPETGLDAVDTLTILADEAAHDDADVDALLDSFCDMLAVIAADYSVHVQALAEPADG